MENNNEVLLRVTNNTGQAEKNLLDPAGRQMMVLGLFDISKQILVYLVNVPVHILFLSVMQYCIYS